MAEEASSTGSMGTSPDEVAKDLLEILARKAAEGAASGAPAEAFRQLVQEAAKIANGTSLGLNQGEEAVQSQGSILSACTDRCLSDYQACGNTTACQNAYWTCLSRC